MLVILSGISGVGKNTIITKLKEKNPEILFYKNATSRERRPGEDLYYYLSKEEFLNRVENDELVEYEEVHGNYYGTLKSEMQKIIDNPNKIYMRDIEVKGNRNLRKYLNGKVKVLSIFLEAPDDVLFERLIARGESEERARVRLSRANLEREYICDYDYVVENIDLEKAVHEIEQYIDLEFKK